MQLPDMQKAKIRHQEKVEYIYDKPIINKELFKDKKYYLRTYGCQMNVHDSEEIRARVENLGFSSCTDIKNADLVILNTCAIRENVHNKVFGFLGRIKHQKKNNPNLIIAIGGCMTQQEVVTTKIMKDYSFVDIVFGTHNINELPNMIINAEEKQRINVYSYEGKVFENIPYNRDSKYKAWVNIMLGCDKFCTYCIVPFTRGKQRSRKSEDIIKEIEELVSLGYKEITLLGQNVNAYGKDLENEIDFAKLLEQASATNIPRIRFVTSHPWDFTDEMIEIISEKDNIMPYIHLPLQAGSNNILKKMGRRYTKEEYFELVKKIKNKIPHVSITTDIIVGFPNETKEDFQDTLDVVNEVKYDGAFTFIYSPRKGTAAALIPDDITKEEKEERLQILNEEVNKYSLENNKKYLNKIVPVLVEGYSEKDKTKLFGYTDTMKLINFEGDDKLIGSIIDVQITDAKSFSLDGIVSKIKETI